MIASIVDTDALLEVIWVSIVAGIGLTAVYGVAIVGASRAVDLGRQGDTVSAVLFGALGDRRAGGGRGGDRARHRDAERQVARRSGGHYLGEPVELLVGRPRAHRGAQVGRAGEIAEHEAGREHALEHRGLVVDDERHERRAPARCDLDAAALEPLDEPGRELNGSRLDAVDAGLLEDVERGVRPLDLMVCRESWCRAGARPDAAASRAGREGPRAPASPARGHAGRRSGQRARRRSRSRSARTSTSGPRRRRSRSRARSRRRAPRRGPGRRRAAPALRSRRAPAASTTLPVIQDTCEQTTMRVSGSTAADSSSKGAAHAHAAGASRGQRGEHARVLLVGGEKLVARLAGRARAARS